MQTPFAKIIPSRINPMRMGPGCLVDDQIRELRKRRARHPIFLLALVAAISLVFAGHVTAQTFSNLYSFSAGTNNPMGGVDFTAAVSNFDGAYPSCTLILVSNKLYGTCATGGSNQNGTLFAIGLDGTGFTNLHTFSAVNSPVDTNSDGARPLGSLVASNDTLYGTTSSGGVSGCGVVFSVKLDGSSFTNLFNFRVTNGSLPNGSLILSSNRLFGTTYGGGDTNNKGTVFAINTDGSGFTNLHIFSWATGNGFNVKNPDGVVPNDGLAISGDTLFGTTFAGGTSGFGTVFGVSTDGSIFTNLHNFSVGNSNNTDGYDPVANLSVSGGTLYGTTTFGGIYGQGTLFSVIPHNRHFTVLHDFDGTNGGYCVGGLIVANNSLYGLTGTDGIKPKAPNGNGAVYAVGGLDLTNYTAMQNFTNLNASHPYGSLLLIGNAFYGTTYDGGAFRNGSVFKVSFTPQLAMTLSASNVVLDWPTNVFGFDYTGYSLQCAATFNPTNWNAVSPPPVLANGMNTVTNAISGAQMFYRLSH